MTAITTPIDAVRPLVEINAEGVMRLNFHKGQYRAWKSNKEIILVLAGSQGGKSSFGPHWLRREIQRRGPGDYMVVAPTFPTLDKKARPEIKRLFETQLQVGHDRPSDNMFVFHEAGCRRLFGDYNPRVDPPTQIFYGYALKPESLEAATAKAVWMDEAGQKDFKVDSWEALYRRTNINEGRILITTTPYNRGWLKTRLFDPWQKAMRTDGDHPDIDVIRFTSIMNPAFPRRRWDKARTELPAWKFNMFYRAIFEIPVGLIYDNFDEETQVIAPFPIPDDWPRYLGVDFGGVNTAGAYFASKPGTDELYLYREYWPREKREIEEHVEAMLEGEPDDIYAVGGAPSEEQWRTEFGLHGLEVHAPAISDVELMIQRVRADFARHNVFVFDTCENWVQERGAYARKLDENGEPTDKIEDPHSFHLMDCTRYPIGGHLRHTYEAGVINIETLKHAMERWESWQRLMPGEPKITSVAISAAHNQAAIAVCADNQRILSIERQAVRRTRQSEFVGLVLEALRVWVTPDDRVPLFINPEGSGIDLVHSARDLGYTVGEFINTAETAMVERAGQRGFANWWSAAWWMMREMLDPDGSFDICLPYDHRLLHELTAAVWNLDKAQRIMVDPYDRLTKSLGNEPYSAEAVLMALFGPVLWRDMIENRERVVVGHDRPPAPW